MKNDVFRMLCMLAKETRSRNSTYAALCSFNIDGKYFDSQLTIPETLFVFHLCFFAKKGGQTGPWYGPIVDLSL
jgi:hypothetical protein